MSDIPIAIGRSIRKIKANRHIGAAITIIICLVWEGPLGVSSLWLDHHLGFIGGMVALTILWPSLSLMLTRTSIWAWVVPEVNPHIPIAEQGRIRRWVARSANYSSLAAGILTSFLIGPLFGPPIFRWLGYRGRAVTLWIIASAIIFCPFWYAFYVLSLNFSFSYLWS